jgi:acetylornithine aminotransferase
MARPNSHPLRSLLDAPRVREAAQALVEAVRAEAADRELSPKGYERALREIGRMRGRPLPLALLSGGTGRGARVRLADGRSVLDFVSGIGTYLFGHSDDDLLETAVVAAAGDAVYQGHLMPGAEYRGLLKALLRHTGPRIQHGWLSISGAMANENALKIVLQKRAPADMGSPCRAARSMYPSTIPTTLIAPWPLSMRISSATRDASRRCYSS